MTARSRIAREIAARGGWVSFADYMALALREYYGSGGPTFGPDGDFVTAPELGTLFGKTLARGLPFQRILELGAGSGKLAEALLAELGTATRIEVTLGAGGTRPVHLLARRRRPLDLPLALSGEMIVAESPRGADALPDLLRWLLAEGVEILNVHLRQPGLADVFQHLTGKRWEETR